LPAVANKAVFRETTLTNAVVSAATQFNTPTKPLVCFSLQGKKIFQLAKLQDELVVRKLVKNLKRCVPQFAESRSRIVSNLQLLLAEGVPYRVYRLDIRSFYESFQKNDVLETVRELRYLSPQSKTLIETLLNTHAEMGGSGIPRGLSLSATLSDLRMKQFDLLIRSKEDTFYYARYVDDIVIVTSAMEKKTEFMTWIKNSLPSGLKLNPDKRKIVEFQGKVAAKANDITSSLIISFDYLGYTFSVRDPTKGEKNKKRNSDLNRYVSIDISNRKIKKLKTRIVRSFIDFISNKGNRNAWELLRDRILFLTQNFSVYNPKTGNREKAGIYHSYPLVADNSAGLIELDCFFRNAVLARTGRVFSKSVLLLSRKQKQRLLSFSFVQGHQTQGFVYFSAKRIHEIQRCWAY